MLFSGRVPTSLDIIFPCISFQVYFMAIIFQRKSGPLIKLYSDNSKLELR